MAPCIRFLQQEYKLFAKGEVKGGGGGQIHVYIGYPNQFQVIPNLSNKCKIKQFSWDLKLTWQFLWSHHKKLKFYHYEGKKKCTYKNFLSITCIQRGSILHVRVKCMTVLSLWIRLHTCVNNITNWTQSGQYYTCQYTWLMCVHHNMLHILYLHVNRWKPGRSHWRLPPLKPAHNWFPSLNSS